MAAISPIVFQFLNPQSPALLLVNGPMRLQGEIAMPIRPELRPLYPPHWRELSSQVRFVRAGGKCQRCGRPHLAHVRCLPDGRWFDEQAATWRDRHGRMARWPDLVEATRFRMTRVVLAAAHLDSDPTNNRMKNLRAFCQRCHMLHDRPHHLAQRWISYRRRLAHGDLFLGPYPALIAMSPSTYPTHSVADIWLMTRSGSVHA
jgi:hypothetical protein